MFKMYVPVMSEGEQVRRELDAPERHPQRLREGLDQRRLGDPGDPLQEDVAPAQERHQEQLDGLLRADVDLPDRRPQRPRDAAHLVQRGLVQLRALCALSFAHNLP
jgi:hypothetical protein